ncbi:MAG: serine/threonine-protein kinase [Myxococcota bacterium]|jgi:serine/threonine-protein kinase
MLISATSGASFKRCALAQLRHAHVVHVFAAGVTNGTTWIAMERVASGSLLRRVNTSGPLSRNEVIRAGEQALLGLQAAHDAGVIHRDVKPQNMWVDEWDNLKLCDFGVARWSTPERVDLTRTGDRLGTLSYMAPEQRMNPSAVDSTVDQYALGATLYAVATCKKPKDFSLSMFSEDVLKVVPAWLRPIVDRATKVSPRDRYPSTDAMREALISLRSNE